MKQNIKIMIAGGCGFIGSSLANFFLHKYPSSKIYIFHKKSVKDFVRSAYGLITPYFIKRLIKKGINITTHYQVILNYFGINNINRIKVYTLDYKVKSRRSPRGKMVFCFQKLS